MSERITSLLLGSAAGRPGRACGRSCARRACGCRTRSRRGGGCSRCGGGGLRGSFQFFRIARRRHDRDQSDVPATCDPHAFRQRDVAEVPGVIDIKAADIDVDGGRNGVGAAAHLDRVRDDR